MPIILSRSSAASVHDTPGQLSTCSPSSREALVPNRQRHQLWAAQHGTSVRRRICTVVVAAALPSAAEASAAGQAEAAVDPSQETARAAQVLVSQAANQQRDGDVVANRQGLALLAAAAAVWAAAHWDAMLAALARIPLPDAAAVLLAAAAVLRLMPARARAGAAHLTALLQSVFLLGSVAYDIGEVRKDIKQLRSAMQGLAARAAWVPPKLSEQERQQQQRQKRKPGAKRDGPAAGVHKA